MFYISVSCGVVWCSVVLDLYSSLMKWHATLLRLRENNILLSCGITRMLNTIWIFIIFRNQFRTDVPAQVSQGDSHAVRFHETPSQNSPFSRNEVLDSLESAEVQNTQEPSTRWGPGDSPNLASGLEDANPSYPYLPTVLEEPGSSFSEGNYYAIKFILFKTK